MPHLPGDPSAGYRRESPLEARLFQTLLLLNVQIRLLQANTRQATHPKDLQGSPISH